MIDLMPDEDQDALVEWVRDILEKELPRTRLLTSDAHDTAVAELMPRIGALGWFRLAGEDDTPGPRYVDEILLFRELGRYLVPGPLIATTIAADLAALVGNEDLAGALAAGTSLAGLAERIDDERVLVLGSVPVDYLLVVDSRRAELTLVRYSDLPGHDLVASIDPFHDVAIVEASFDEPVAAAGEFGPRLLAHARLITAAYLTGLAEGARDDSAAYTTQRVQFGTPIAVFQAVKHRCADNAVRAEAAWAQTIVAALRLAQAPVADAALDVNVAKIISGDAAVLSARDNIQNHGGMGYTAENLAHLYLKRAHVLVNVFGDARSFTGTLLESTPSW
jgi:alkylation response protein AidB-like acyl-CoA dehydrogenase